MISSTPCGTKIRENQPAQESESIGDARFPPDGVQGLMRDAPAPDALYGLYGPMVLRRARAMLGDDHAAHDAAQEIFERALRAWSEFRADASPVTWLYRATTNHCLN